MIKQQNLVNFVQVTFAVPSKANRLLLHDATYAKMPGSQRL